MENTIKEIFYDSIKVKEKSAEILIPEIKRAVKIIIEALEDNKKILICGNGGSAADAQHFTGELICTFENRKRRSLPAISLNSNTSVITAYANDFDYDGIFKRQIEGLGNDGDVLIGITTSGNSKNVIQAFDVAKQKNMKTICLNGNDGGKMNELNLDINIVVPSKITARIQEVHITIIHSICKIIEEEMFKG